METICLNCGSANVRSHTHNMLRCQDCSFFFLTQAERDRQQAQFATETVQEPSKERIASLKQKYPKDNPPRKHLYQRYAKKAIEWYDTDLQALDIGASGGFFLYELEQRGVPAEHLIVNEIDHSYIALTQDYFGYQTEVTNIEQYQPDRQFDLVTMFDVLEHIADVDKTLEIIYSALKPGGRLLLKLPNGRFAYAKYRLAQLLRQPHKIPVYLYLAPGGHLNYWNPRNINYLQSRGFTLEETHTLKPTKQQFGRQYWLRSLGYKLDRLFGTDLFPEFVAILQKPLH